MHVPRRKKMFWKVETEKLRKGVLWGPLGLVKWGFDKRDWYSYTSQDGVGVVKVFV